MARGGTALETAVGLKLLVLMAEPELDVTGEWFAGAWLPDPHNITIAAGAGAKTSIPFLQKAVGYSNRVSNSRVNSDDVENQLRGGTNIAMAVLVVREGEHNLGG